MGVRQCINFSSCSTSALRRDRVVRTGPTSTTRLLHMRLPSRSCGVESSDRRLLPEAPCSLAVDCSYASMSAKARAADRRSRSARDARRRTRGPRARRCTLQPDGRHAHSEERSTEKDNTRHHDAAEQHRCYSAHWLGRWEPSGGFVTTGDVSHHQLIIPAACDVPVSLGNLASDMAALRVC